jgi:hypothetical protein
MSGRTKAETIESFLPSFLQLPRIPAPLQGRAGVGAVPRRKADREAGRHCFFEKKQQKTLIISALGCLERSKPNSQ